MRNLIEGYNELEKKLGYEPNFHDDNIEKVTITMDGIAFLLKTVEGVFYSLIFEDLKEFGHEEIDFEKSPMQLDFFRKKIIVRKFFK